MGVDREDADGHGLMIKKVEDADLLLDGLDSHPHPLGLGEDRCSVGSLESEERVGDRPEGIL